MKQKRTSRLALIGILLSIYAAASLPAEAQATYPRSFTDARGNIVTLTKKPVRIASVALGIDENLLDLVEPSRIVAMSALSRDPYLSNIADRIPPGTLFVTDEWEPVINAKPDLVLTTCQSHRGYTGFRRPISYGDIKSGITGGDD
jgi:ABC-type Fe3+-hydroxamate transport system substrate-binding protein